MKMTRQAYTRLLTIGFALLLSYQVAMYFIVYPGLNFEMLIVPTFLRSFGYTIFFVTMTLYLEELMPFQHFFMGLTICGFIRNGLLSTMTESIYAFLLRYHIMDNLVSAHPYTPEMSLLTGIKQLYGVTCMGGCFFLLLLMLWHVSPVRSTLKHLPYRRGARPSAHLRTARRCRHRHDAFLTHPQPLHRAHQESGGNAGAERHNGKDVLPKPQLLHQDFVG